jgi:PTS system nitrogen regulatory IIA component
MINDEILTLSETAEYLKVAEKTIQRMITAHRIPCTRVGNQWRFIKSVLDDWLMESMNDVGKGDISRLMETGELDVSLSRLLIHTVIPLASGSRRDVLSQLAEPLIKRDMIKNPEGYLNKLEDRENMISTGVGGGIAIPHIRNPKENELGAPCIVAGISPEGIDFQAIDGKPVKLFFLVHSNSETIHLRILSRLTNMIKDQGIDDFILCKNKEELEKVIMQKETGSQ